MHTPTKDGPKLPSWFNRDEGPLLISKTADDRIKGDLTLVSEKHKSIYINRVVRKNPPWYTLDWCWRQDGFYGPHISGRIELDSAEMACAFAIDDTMHDKSSAWLLEVYGGTVAVHKKFIRRGRYLNIPGPGIGRDGDANISIFISPEIWNEVSCMLRAHTKKKV